MGNSADTKILQHGKDKYIVNKFSHQACFHLAMKRVENKSLSSSIRSEQEDFAKYYLDCITSSTTTKITRNYYK